MTYLDGAIYAVPTNRKEEYREHSQHIAKLFKEYGALKVVDCWGVDVPEGELTSMPMAVKCQANETVCFSWITWPSQEVQKEAWEKIMQDERMHKMGMPFDGKRMIFGGFEVISEA
ncbi:MAG: DUF1428 domain-containing protein [Pseudomonadota bacterium]